MKRTFALSFMLFVFAPLHVLSQTGTGLLAPNRMTPAANWGDAGAGVIPTRTQFGSTISAGASAATIQSQLTSCAAANPSGSGQYVLLGAGTFNLSTSIVTTASNCSLRGSGPKSTILKFSATSSNCIGIGATAMCIWNGDSGTLNSVANVCSWAGGYSSGTTTITAGSCSTGSLANLHNGSIITLNQLDSASDTGNWWPCGNTTCSQQGDGGNTINGRSEIQQVTVTNISGSNITVSPAVHAPNWSSGKTPQFQYSSSLPISKFGLEDLTVDTSTLTTGAAMVMFSWATNSWVRNVSLINNTGNGDSMHKHVWVAASNHITVRDSYMYGASPSSEGYGVDFWESSSNLAENNICQHLPTCEIMEGGSGNVFGYHYAVDNYYNGGLDPTTHIPFSPNWQQCDQFHHNAGDYYNLWEGGIGVCHTEDSIHGTAFSNTVFRNALSGFDPAQTGSGANGAPPNVAKNNNILAVNNMANARYQNYVANILDYGKFVNYHYIMTSANDCGPGTPSQSSALVFAFDDSGQIIASAPCYTSYTVLNDVSAARGSSSSMLWGNCDPINGCRTVGSENASGAPTYPGLASPSTAWSTFPSLYLSGIPSWWRFPSGTASPWPGIGPEVTGGNIAGTSGRAWLNPAANCYLNVMHGLTDGSTGSLQASFDANVCYTGGTVSFTWTPTIAPSGGGTLSGLNCAAGTYPTGTTIGPCTANSSGTFTFANWSAASGNAACSGATNPCPSFTLTSNSAVTANFSPTPSACGDPTQNGPNFSGAYFVPPTILPLNIAFTSPTGGCVMHYTLDGSLPTCSSLTYPGGGFNVSSTTTARVIACQSGFTSSNPVGGTWTINVTTYPLTVNTTGSGTGTISGTNCSTGSYAPSTTIGACTATPAAGSLFTGWSGGTCSGVGACGPFSLSGPATITADFEPSFTLSVATSGSGSVSGTNCTTGVYVTGTSVVCNETPAAGFTFTGWSGGTCSGTGSCSFSLSGNSVVQANFSTTTFTFGISSAGSGSGTFSGTNCANGTYATGTSIACTGNASTGSTFTGFSGTGSASGCSGTGICTFSLTSNSTATGTFTINTYTLAVSTVGSGSLSGTNCANGTYNYNTAISCTATPSAGFVFTGWSGGTCSGTGACSFNISANSTVTATFVQTYTYSQSTSGSGSGTISGCSNGTYNSGTAFSCVANPSGGSTFAGWTGSGSASACSTGTCTFSIAANTTLSAAFAVTVANPTFSPVAGTYSSTQTVTISAAGGVTICWTNDNSTPTATAGTCTHGTTYSGTITVNTTQTLKAIGSESGFTNSSVVSAGYIINGTVATPTFTPGAGNYGNSQKVTISSTTPGATIHYTVDGTTPTTSSPVFRHSLKISKSQTLSALGAKSGFTNSAVGTATYTIGAQVTSFGLTTTSPSVAPVPFPNPSRDCCNDSWYQVETSRGTYSWTSFDAWTTQANSNSVKRIYTIRGVPYWASGTVSGGSSPPTDTATTAACSGVLTGTTTDGCQVREFVTAMLEHLTGTSSVPAVPINCTGLDYIETMNEFNTDSSTGAQATGWNGNYVQAAEFSNQISDQVHQFCSNTEVVAGSASGIVGFHSNSENGHYDVALQTMMVNWAALPNASLPDSVSFHAYPSRNNVSPTPFPTTLVSNSDTTCTSGNTPNVSCYVPVYQEVTQVTGSAVLQNATIKSWAAFLNVYSTEGGYGTVAQVCGSGGCTGTETDTIFLRSAYVSESMLMLAAQPVGFQIMYAGNDNTWGCYWSCPSVPSPGWYPAFVQTSTWLANVTMTGSWSSSSVSGGNVWTAPCTRLGNSCQFIFFDGWYPTTSTQATAFNTQQNLAGTVSSTGGSVTLTQKPMLLFNVTPPAPTGLTGNVVLKGAGIKVQ